MVSRKQTRLRYRTLEGRESDAATSYRDIGVVKTGGLRTFVILFSVEKCCAGGTVEPGRVVEKKSSDAGGVQIASS